MNWELIQGALYAWAAAAMGIPVWWADQDYPRNAFPYARLRITSDVPIGQDEVRYEDPGADADLNQFVTGQRQFVLSIQVFARSKWPTQNARFYLSKLRDTLKAPAGLALLAPADVKILGVEDSQDLSQLADGAMESRASLDLRMGASARTAAGASSYLRQVELTGTLQGTNNPPDFETTVDFGTLGET